ncbi:MAG: hypothetical protein J6S49_05000 [Erysipelotrichaceae bacterium]|nr:hypothetical protein [Erysipelotrichaceae bacterium]MBO7698804.1 hypothetical protein [Erysipelotrichaceae bacterium]MBP5279303.1 hypothetical protein [Erysipelotrichaceae bacterium]
MKDFDRKLSNLFDYQRFERNKDLQRIINDVEHRYDSSAVLLTEAELSFAAGGRDVDRTLTDKEIKKKIDEEDTFGG